MSASNEPDAISAVSSEPTTVEAANEFMFHVWNDNGMGNVRAANLIASWLSAIEVLKLAKSFHSSRERAVQQGLDIPEVTTLFSVIRAQLGYTEVGYVQLEEGNKLISDSTRAGFNVVLDHLAAEMKDVGAAIDCTLHLRTWAQREMWMARWSPFTHDATLIQRIITSRNYSWAEILLPRQIRATELQRGRFDNATFEILVVLFRVIGSLTMIQPHRVRHLKHVLRIYEDRVALKVGTNPPLKENLRTMTLEVDQYTGTNLMWRWLADGSHVTPALESAMRETSLLLQWLDQSIVPACVDDPTSIGHTQAAPASSFQPQVGMRSDAPHLALNTTGTTAQNRATSSPARKWSKNPFTRNNSTEGPSSSSENKTPNTATPISAENESPLTPIENSKSKTTIKKRMFEAFSFTKYAAKEKQGSADGSKTSIDDKAPSVADQSKARTTDESGNDGEDKDPEEETLRPSTYTAPLSASKNKLDATETGLTTPSSLKQASSNSGVAKGAEEATIGFPSIDNRPCSASKGKIRASASEADLRNSPYRRRRGQGSGGHDQTSCSGSQKTPTKKFMSLSLRGKASRIFSPRSEQRDS